jgi:hypothetical protein
VRRRAHRTAGQEHLSGYLRRERADFLAIRERPAFVLPALAIRAALLLLLPPRRSARYVSCRDAVTNPNLPPLALTMAFGYPATGRRNRLT